LSWRVSGWCPTNRVSSRARFDPPGIRWSDAKGDREEFQVPAGGATSDGFRWRTDPDVKLNFVWLYIYTQKPAGHRMQIWFDDLVVATRYIGPIQPASQSP